MDNINTNPLTLPCPAKLNLMLLILGQRPDGYHDLQTVFQLLDYGDELTIAANMTGKICISPEIEKLPVEDNLIYKAANLLKDKIQQPELGADIVLTKYLPMGGGIGGGSSNAATTLLALNALWNTRLSMPELSVLGRTLGADVPVFIEGRSAWAEGIGEKLSPLNLPEKWFVVLAPDCHVSTHEIFSHKCLTKDSTAIKVAAFLERGGKNDCQTLVESLFPQVRDAVEWLNKYSQAQLTGTGACVFAPFDSKEAAQAIFAKKPDSMKGFIAKGINHSPVHHSLP